MYVHACTWVRIHVHSRVWRRLRFWDQIVKIYRTCAGWYWKRRHVLPCALDRRMPNHILSCCLFQQHVISEDGMLSYDVWPAGSRSQTRCTRHTTPFKRKKAFIYLLQTLSICLPTFPARIEKAEVGVKEENCCWSQLLGVRQTFSLGSLPKLLQVLVTNTIGNDMSSFKGGQESSWSAFKHIAWATTRNLATCKLEVTWCGRMKMDSELRSHIRCTSYIHG